MHHIMAQSTNQSGTVMEAQPVVATPRFKVPPTPSVTHPLIAHPIDVQPTMLVEEQTILGRFFILADPRFVCALSKDVYGFMISCTDGLCNLGLVKTHAVDSTTF